jgi:hypothetical protein
MNLTPPDPICRYCDDTCSGTCEGAREAATPPNFFAALPKISYERLMSLRARYYHHSHGESRDENDNVAEECADVANAIGELLRLRERSNTPGEDELYRLLVVRGYAQHEALQIAFCPNLARINCNGSGFAIVDQNGGVGDCPGCPDCATTKRCTCGVGVNPPRPHDRSCPHSTEYGDSMAEHAPKVSDFLP